MRFAPGEVLVRRCWRGGKITFLMLTRVAADDDQGLRLWLPAGYPYWRSSGADGLTREVWTGSDVLLWHPEGSADPLGGRSTGYSVWWFWREGNFDGWHVNLEEPYQRWADRGSAGIDTADHALDLKVATDGRWRWNEEDEFRARTGHPMYWTSEHAERIRATGERLGRLAEQRAFPFDGTWNGYRPDAGWTVPALPPGADRPRALVSLP